jgi:hypothetical protein
LIQKIDLMSRARELKVQPTVMVATLTTPEMAAQTTLSSLPVESSSSSTRQYQHMLTMAPTLAAAQHDQIRDMIFSGKFTDVQMASIAGCSERSVQTIRLNLQPSDPRELPQKGWDVSEAFTYPKRLMRQFN